jgi:hypothetical protein
MTGAALTVLFFVTHDCPISNRYAPEIRRICADYAARGVSCQLVFVDPGLPNAAAKAHARSYNHGPYPVVVDRTHDLVRKAGATTTPEAAVLTRAGEAVYLGRIDDLYSGWGKARRVVTEPSLRRALDAALAGKPAPSAGGPPVGCFIADLAAKP